MTKCDAKNASDVMRSGLCFRWCRQVLEPQQLGVFGSRQKDSTMPDLVIKLQELIGPIFVLIWIY
jgi:hypothetical protein